MNDFEIRSKLRTVYMELSEKYDFHCDCYLDIVISDRLRCSNGTIETERARATGEILTAKVTMSRALLIEFGWESFEKTFRHEMAHLADRILNGKMSHSYSFKELCDKFGGTMNRKIAGVLYAHCADTDYVKPIVKWIYTCGGCGYEKKMGKRMNKNKRNSPNYRCRRCKTSLDNWKEMKVV